MRYSKYGPLLGGILLAVGLLLALTPAAFTTLAAAKAPMSAANAAKVSARTAPVLSAHLALNNACPPADSSCQLNACPPGVSEPDHNDWVAVLQWRLDLTVGANLNPDGVFGDATKAAVTTFQNDTPGLAGGGGAVGDRTWSALGFCLGYEFFPDFIAQSGTTTLTDCPAAESNGGSDNSTFVMAIQDLLNIDYYVTITDPPHTVLPDSPYEFDPYLASDGSFGPLTQNAVTDFQHQWDISDGGGVVGDRTWSELGMCRRS